jgi:hypothetical protein
MATRKEEKERLRQARLEAERRETEAARRRLIFGYVAAGLIGAVVLAGIVAVILAGGGGGASGAAHINVSSGSTNDVKPDGRDGTPPPPVKEADLRVAAQKAGCDLRLGLRDEGHTHIAP